MQRKLCFAKDLQFNLSGSRANSSASKEIPLTLQFPLFFQFEDAFTRGSDGFGLSNEMETIIYINRNMTQTPQEMILLQTWHPRGPFPNVMFKSGLWRDWATSSRLWPLCLKIKLKDVLKYIRIYGKDDTERFPRDQRMSTQWGICPEAHSLSWLLSSVLISCKFILFNKSYLFIKQMSVVSFLCLFVRVFKNPLSYKVSPCWVLKRWSLESKESILG